MLIELEPMVGVRADGETEPILILAEKNGPRHATCIFSQAILREIFMAIRNLSDQHPSVHIVLYELLHKCKVALVHFSINSIDDDGGVNCSLTLRQGEQTWCADCEIGDGIALALRSKAPILCEESVFSVISADVELRIVEPPSEIDERIRLFKKTHPDGDPKA